MGIEPRLYQRDAQEGTRSDLETVLADGVVQRSQSAQPGGLAASSPSNERNPRLHQKHGGFDISETKLKEEYEKSSSSAPRIIHK